jgi:hypothetical protein
LLVAGQRASAFGVYWKEMERCRQSKAYWALLHVTVCIPDICGALESNNGEARRSRYIAWSNSYLPDSLLSGAERYLMRCKVLHQGRAALGALGRYTGFSFAQPASTGRLDHRRIQGSTLILDAGELSKEVEAGANKWIAAVEATPSTPAALNVEKHLPSLVQVRQFLAPARIDDFEPIIINRTS